MHFNIAILLKFIKLNSFKIKNFTDTDGFLDIKNEYLKVCIKDENFLIILNDIRYMINYFGICVNDNLDNIKIDLREHICINNCDESEFKYEFNNICFHECPNNTF